MEIDRTSPQPLYFQVARGVREQLVAGIYQPGEKLPNEAELAAQLQISRPTVRQAFDLLVKDRLISREHGRGTFVRNVPFTVSGLRLQSSIGSLLSRSGVPREPTSTVTLQADISFGASVVTQLKGARNTGTKVSRLLTNRGRPYAIVEDFIPDPIAAHVNETSLREGGVYAAITRGGEIVARAIQSIRAREASATQAQLLQISSGSALLNVERVAFGATDVPIVLTRQFFAGDVYSDVVEFSS